MFFIFVNQVLGQSKQWKGGDVLHFPGGGQKVNMLREVLSSLEKTLDQSKLIMFVDRLVLRTVQLSSRWLIWTFMRR